MTEIESADELALVDFWLRCLCLQIQWVATSSAMHLPSCSTTVRLSMVSGYEKSPDYGGPPFRWRKLVYL